jgi:hypothetical protein
MTPDWKDFDYKAIHEDALWMFYEHNRNGIRTSPVMPQDNLEYWIAVAAWQRAKNNVTPIGSTRWR